MTITHPLQQCNKYTCLIILITFWTCLKSMECNTTKIPSQFPQQLAFAFGSVYIGLYVNPHTHTHTWQLGSTGSRTGWSNLIRLLVSCNITLIFSVWEYTKRIRTSTKIAPNNSYIFVTVSNVPTVWQQTSHRKVSAGCINLPQQWLRLWSTIHLSCILLRFPGNECWHSWMIVVSPRLS